MDWLIATDFDPVSCLIYRLHKLTSTAYMAGSRTSLVFLRIIYSTWNPIPIHFSSYRTASLFTPSYPHQHLLFPLLLPCSPPSPSSYSYSFLFLLFLEVLDKEPGPLLMLGKLSAPELSLWPLPFFEMGSCWVAQPDSEFFTYPCPPPSEC